MRSKLNKQIINSIILIIIIIIILYFVVYIIWVYPMNNLSKYQDKPWIKKIREDLILGIKDPKRLYNIRKYEKNILTFWYCYWFFHTKRYTIWAMYHLKNKFSTKGVIRLYYYDFLTKENKMTILDIDFTEIKTFSKGDKIIIMHNDNYKQEIDMDNNKMSILINTNNLKLDFTLSIDDYSTQFPALMPRYEPLKGIFDFTQTKCPDEWGFDMNKFGKIINGTFNHKYIEGGNFWFDNFLGVNNMYLSENVWVCLLNDDWLIFIILYDKEENIKLKKNILKGYIIKDIKNNKVISCGMDTSISPLYNGLDKIVHPQKMECEYISKDNFEIHYEIPNFKIDLVSTPNETSKNSKNVINDYYKTDKGDVSNVSQWDSRYYKKLEKLEYTELVTLAQVDIVYNKEKIHFTERVVVNGIEDFENTPNVYCEKSKLRDYFM